MNNFDEVPLTTHADHYHHNRGYGVASYSKGCLFLNQLRYIVGDDAFYAAMKQYFNRWKFKHPTPADFKYVLEQQSGLELDWFFESWIGTTQTIDYSIKQVSSANGKTTVLIERIGEMPMPLEVEVVTDKRSETYYIPLEKMRGEKAGLSKSSIVSHDWRWTYPYYELVINAPLDDIQLIILDPDGHVADVDPTNDQFPATDSSLIESN